MPEHSLADQLAALELALDELEAAASTDEPIRVLTRLGAAIHWLYAASEAADRGDASSDAAQTLAELRWVRGKATHRGAVVRELRWLGASRMVKQGDTWVPAKVEVKQGDSWEAADDRVATDSWADSSAFRGRSGEFGRSEYEKHVAGRPLMQPLRVAQAHLNTLRARTR